MFALNCTLMAFDKIYDAKRSRYIDGYKLLKAGVKPLGA